MQKKQYSNFLLYFAATMGVLYIFCGFYIATAGNLNLPFGDTGRYVFGALLIAYGVFRLYGVYQKKKDQV